MFHLFKRVYLELDASIDLNVNRYVISKDNGFELLNDLQEVVHAQLLNCATSLEELIGDGKPYDNLLLFLNEVNHKTDELGKVVIYCDKDTYLKLAVTWIKIILTNATVDDAYDIIASNLFQTRMLGTSELADYTRPYRLNFVDKYVSLQEFYAVFNSVTVQRDHFDGFVQLVKSGLSLEFILASYLYNKTYKDELKAIAHNQLKNGLQLFLYECKTFIIQHLLNKDVISQFGPTVEYTPGTLEKVITDPAFDVWFEPSIWGVESVAVPHTKSLIYFENITPSQYDKLTQHLAIWMQQYNAGCKPGTMQAGDEINSWFAKKVKALTLCRQQSLSDMDLDDIVNVQVTQDHCEAEFSLFESVEQSKFSIYITEHIRQLFIADKKSRLAAFVLP